MSEPTKHSRISFTFVVIAMLALMFAAFAIVVNLPGGTLKISKDTTYITGPLKSDGKTIDYLAAAENMYYTPTMKTDENGFRLIVQKLGADAVLLSYDSGSPEHTRQMYEKLDLTPPTEILGKYTDIQKVFQDYAAKTGADITSLQKIFESPWTLEDLSFLEDWLKEADPVLDLVVQAANKNDFCIPLVRETENTQLFAITLQQHLAIRQFTMGLSARASYRIATGDFDGAITDKIACARLGRFMQRVPILVAFLVGLSLETISDNIEIYNHPDGKPNEEQLKRLIQGYAELPPPTPIDSCFVFERYMALDSIQSFYDQRPFDLGIRIPTRGVDWNQVMKRFNKEYDAILEGGFSYSEKSPIQKVASFASTRSRSELVADIFVASFLPAIDAVMEAEKRQHCNSNLNSITLALLLYHEQNGAFPPTFLVDSEGKPLHSWRVLILPQLGHQELYDKVKLDEPWDGEHNKQFHETDVPFYQCPSLVEYSKKEMTPLGPGETNYVVITGNEMPFDTTGKGKKMSDIPRNGNKTILVTEQTITACWMDPGFDISLEDAKVGLELLTQHSAEKRIWSHHAGGINVGFMDGSCKFIKSPNRYEPKSELKTLLEPEDE